MPKAKQGEAVASCEAEAEEALEEEDEAPVLGAEVAFAKSGRSCCKECRKPIAMGALRIGADFIMDYGPAEGKVLTSWRHPECFSLPENECREVEDLRGFEDLSSAQRKKVRDAIIGGMTARGEIEEEEEEEEPPPPPPPPPKKRKKEAAAPAPAKKVKADAKKAKKSPTAKAKKTAAKPKKKKAAL